jgi:AmmeMemoRadiSam system protein B
MGTLTGHLRARSRSPLVSGLFYPEDRAELTAALRSFGLESGVGGAASAIIAPHGAWDLSGAVAAGAFRSAAGRCGEVSTVVFLGNIHHAEAPGVYFSDSCFFTTPLGRLRMDQEISESLASCSTLFEINDIPHLQETSLETLFPMAKYCFPAATIVPILMKGAQPRLIAALAWALQIVLEPIRETTLVVVSSAISVHTDEKTAQEGAETCVRLLEENKPDAFIAALYDGRIHSCGGALIAALLKSGLVADKTAVLTNGSPASAREAWGETSYYGGVAFA